MSAAPYSALAAGYDFVMAHVDYDAWAAYLFELLRRHGTDVETVVELGGGTGTLARRLQALGGYRYVLSDGSAAMLDRAREKLRGEEGAIRCVQADFTALSRDRLGLEGPADAVILVYDGLNYLLDEADVTALLEGVHGLLRPGGLLGIMTTFQTDDARFAGWHYRRDPTHVVFYRESTLAFIAERMGWTMEIPCANVAIFRKAPVPATRHA